LAVLLLCAFLDPRAGAAQAPVTGTSGGPGTSDAAGVAAIARGVSRIEINGGMALFSEAPEVTIAGSTDAPAGSTVEVSIETPAAPAAPPPAPALPSAAASPPGAARRPAPPARPPLPPPR